MTARRPAAAILLALSAALSAGCVRRTLDVTSDPPGAEVTINGHAAGPTPVRVAFAHHGVYRIELRKEGYEPVVASAPVPRKFYEIDGIDIVAEVLWPGVIVDERSLLYALKPCATLTTAEKERLMAASRQAAEDAERLVPKLYEAPPPNPDAKDYRLTHRQGAKGAGKKEDGKKKEEPKEEIKTEKQGQAPGNESDKPNAD